MKLQKELDEQLGTEDELVTTGQQSKRLPYLDACINEALRLHSTSALGLPRVVPEGGFSVLDQFFPEGTVLSVPSYSIHRDKGIWGDDVEVYRPERWFERDQADIQKTFNPFSFGPRYDWRQVYHHALSLMTITELVWAGTWPSSNCRSLFHQSCADMILSLRARTNRCAIGCYIFVRKMNADIPTIPS